MVFKVACLAMGSVLDSHLIGLGPNVFTRQGRWIASSYHSICYLAVPGHILDIRLPPKHVHFSALSTLALFDSQVLCVYI